MMGNDYSCLARILLITVFFETATLAGIVLIIVSFEKLRVRAVVGIILWWICSSSKVPVNCCEGRAGVTPSIIRIGVSVGA